MPVNAIAMPTSQLSRLGFSNPNLHYQLTPDELVQHTLQLGQGQLSDSQALVIHTGAFTGRSPKDRFFVRDSFTENAVDWNNFNIPIDEKYFHQLKSKLVKYLDQKDQLWVRDCYACANETYRLNVRVINEKPWSNLFAHNMFLRPTDDDLEHFTPDWQIIQSETFYADPATDGTAHPNFTIVSFQHKTILIGGSGYTGEIKKGIFSVLNFLLPHQHNVLSMHCSANVGQSGDTAVFFGLSGTGKTTLSADPTRYLVGDDEHGWDDNGVFNFEGGCYAKIIDLTEDKEPEIYRAIRSGALVENAMFYKNSRQIDFANDAITENTRVSYPLHFIPNALEPSVAGHPENIFFLTCDAAGVLPPISRLNAGQAMYQFISGYTAKVAGTEEGITEPKSTFSACFGAPFMPLHPGFYAQMLGSKMKQHNVRVWLVNTGWSGGPYRVGKRIKLQYTRAMIDAALNNQLDNVDYITHPIFKVKMPVQCPGVPSEILNPKNTWSDQDAYDEKARGLAGLFIQNFKKYESGVSKEILDAAPLPNK